LGGSAVKAGPGDYDKKPQDRQCKKVARKKGIAGGRREKLFTDRKHENSATLEGATGSRRTKERKNLGRGTGHSCTKAKKGCRPLTWHRGKMREHNGEEKIDAWKEVIRGSTSAGMAVEGRGFKEWKLQN